MAVSRAMRSAVKESIASNFFAKKAEKPPSKRSPMLMVKVKIPIVKRGKNHKGKKTSNTEIVQTVSYVLNIFLQEYCAYIGAPKFGPISANGKVVQSGD